MCYNYRRKSCKQAFGASPLCVRSHACEIETVRKNVLASKHFCSCYNGRRKSCKQAFGASPLCVRSHACEIEAVRKNVLASKHFCSCYNGRRKSCKQAFGGFAPMRAFRTPTKLKQFAKMSLRANIFTCIIIKRRQRYGDLEKN